MILNVILVLIGALLCQVVDGVDGKAGLDSPLQTVLSEGDKFDESIYYKIRWPESIDSGEDLDKPEIPSDRPVIKEGEDDGNFVWVTSESKETYYCMLPEKVAKGESGDDSKNAFDGISPYQILKPLFTREVCSYRLEQYWTYELCHGRYVRQFHEESSLQKVKGQEYFLGKYDLTKLSETESTFEAMLEQIKSSGANRPTIAVDGVQLPYIEFNFTDGTVCDLNGKPRTTRVRYVCNEDSKHELNTIKEIYSCEYEAVVFSPLICLHKDFKSNVGYENEINCYPVGKSPAKPVGLSEIESSMRQKSKEDNMFDGKTIIIDAAEVSAKDAFGLDISILDDEGNKLKVKDVGKSPSAPAKPAYDAKIVKEFLSGDLCLQGGTGWWKYEYCHGDRVVQYHEEKGQRTVTITLGKWDRTAHQRWLAANPLKRVKASKTPRQVSHFYSGGDVCGETKNTRQVEVKLKCKPVDGYADSVSLYLIEPKTCEYVLGVESAIVCDLLNSLDTDGVISSSELNDSIEEEDEGEKETIRDRDEL
ncbi:Endoplasmic reticulum lectin 1 [Halotydeus destructor]|nr:Endoplasmic reticulum lectin 1 [Halotydeus destructor]